ncbi:DgyrCDS12167, partial [Dimorphilus gyrociliatus]
YIYIYIYIYMDTETRDNYGAPPPVVRSTTIGYNEEKEPSLVSLIGGLAEKTGMHGLPNVQRSSSHCRKFFWLFITVSGLGLLIWQIVMAVQQFYSYPTTTTEISQNTPSLQFPAVTICNLNPVRVHAIHEAGEDIRSLFRGRESNENGEVNDRPPKFFNWDTEEDDIEDEDFTRSTKFIQYFAALEPKDRKAIGSNISSLLISCTFNGRKCGPKNFTYFSNYLYGNCFTFNAFLSKNSSKRLVSNKPGPLYGLSMTLFINQGEYVKDVAETAGARVIVHDQTDMPFPEDMGISTAPGTMSSIGIRLIKHFREDPPHGKCKNFTSSEIKLRNGFLQELKNISYSEQACKKTCYQQNVILKCGCADPIYNFEGEAFALESAAHKVEIEPCRLDNNTETMCKNKIQTDFSNGNLNCQTKCPPACVEDEYNLAASYSAWPSNVKIVSVHFQIR